MARTARRNRPHDPSSTSLGGKVQHQAKPTEAELAAEVGNISLEGGASTTNGIKGVKGPAAPFTPGLLSQQAPVTSSTIWPTNTVTVPIEASGGKLVSSPSFLSFLLVSCYAFTYSPSLVHPLVFLEGCVFYRSLHLLVLFDLHPPPTFSVGFLPRSYYHGLVFSHSCVSHRTDLSSLR